MPSRCIEPQVPRIRNARISLTFTRIHGLADKYGIKRCRCIQVQEHEHIQVSWCVSFVSFPSWLEEAEHGILVSLRKCPRGTGNFTHPRVPTLVNIIRRGEVNSVQTMEEIRSTMSLVICFGRRKYSNFYAGAPKYGPVGRKTTTYSPSVILLN